MSQNLFFIALDVDDKNFHASIYSLSQGTVLEFVCRPTIGHLEKKLLSLPFDKQNMRLCYEATYIGYTLQRDLTQRGYTCEIIAPSLIPYRPGQSQKTDRLDCRRLAQYYATGQLTPIYIPTREEENVRNIVRTRQFIMKQLKQTKLHLLSQCRLQNLNYKQDMKSASYWTQKHKIWLAAKISQLDELSELNFQFLLGSLDHLEGLVMNYRQRLEIIAQRLEIIAQTDHYRDKVKALSCYRGIDTLTAMTLICELGDVRRFKHPRQLASYAGLDIVEYSSGGKEHRYGISKRGNSHIRMVAIEACQSARYPVRLGVRLKRLQQEVKSEYVAIARRGMERLYHRSTRLLQRGKNANKVKVACARELLCFVWESLRAVGESGEKYSRGIN